MIQICIGEEGRILIFNKKKKICFTIFYWAKSQLGYCFSLCWQPLYYTSSYLPPWMYMTWIKNGIACIKNGWSIFFKNEKKEDEKITT